MTGKKHMIKINDGTYLWAGQPKKGSESSDTWSYHFFNVYESLDDDKPIGMLGFYLTGDVASNWGWGKDDPDELNAILCNVMRLGLPYLKLPITKEIIQTNNKGSRFASVALSNNVQEPVYYAEDKKIIVAGYDSPEDFIKQTVFSGEVTDEKIKDFILKYANTERLLNEMGDGRFMTLNITQELFLPDNAVSRCFSELIDDGYIEPMGQRTLAGFTPFSKLTLLGRKYISKKSQPEPEIKQSPTVPQAPYASLELIKRLELLNQRPLFTIKLIALLDELNECYMNGRPYACHALLRSILDHIPPIFGSSGFSAVADNYTWGRTDKTHMKALKEFRNSADDALHKQIGKKDVLLELQGIPNHRALNVLLVEAITLLESMQSD